jgi:cytochrome c oxidase subunit 2
VFGAMFYSVFAHRRSRHPKPADFHESTSVEILWTIVPFAILVLMAIPAAGTLIKMEDMRGAQMSIKVTGFQWKWHYDYLDKGVVFFSRLDRESDAARHLASGIDPNTIEHYLLNVDNPMVVPAGAKVHLLITAADVIHAWWVPAFGMKKDAIPGMVNTMWFNVDADKTGLYRGQCVELCGRDHGFMPIVVDVKSEADFDAWVKSTADAQKQAAAPQAPAAPATAAAG